MVVFPNCKINLGLNITAKRADGYHDLETVFYPIQLRDIVEIIKSDTLQFTTSGLQINGSHEDNLCLKAYHLLKTDFTALPPVHIHLNKVIPMGAGLGGGSSDAAFTLMLLNRKFNLNLNTQQLLTYAAQLGSDCPFFIQNTPCFATGRGENLTPIEVSLKDYTIVLVNPGIHISTAEAFSYLTPKQPARSIAEIIEQPASTWKDALVNDFEEPIFRSYPPIEAIKNALYQSGADYAAMSGSGSTVFGLFHQNKITLPAFDPAYQVFTL